MGLDTVAGWAGSVAEVPSVVPTWAEEEWAVLDLDLAAVATEAVP